MEIVGMSIVTFETDVVNLQMTLSQKNCHRIKSSKLTILVSSCWKKILRINAHSYFILSLDRRCCILSGSPCTVGCGYLVTGLGDG